MAKLKHIAGVAKKLQASRDEALARADAHEAAAANAKAAVAAAVQTAGESISRLESELADARAFDDEACADAERAGRDLRLAASEAQDRAALIEKLEGVVSELQSQLEKTAQLQASYLVLGDDDGLEMRIPLWIMWDDRPVHCPLRFSHQTVLGLGCGVRISTNSVVSILRSEIYGMQHVGFEGHTLMTQATVSI